MCYIRLCQHLTVPHFLTNWGEICQKNCIKYMIKYGVSFNFKMFIITTKMLGKWYIVLCCNNTHKKKIIATHLGRHLFPSVSEPAVHTVFQH